MKEKLNYIDSKYLFGGTALILVITIISGSLYLNPISEDPEGDELQVVATFYPFYDIGSNIGGEQAEFDTLVPAGTDPHSFDPSPSDRQKLEDADIFIATGAEFEEWEAELISDVEDDTVIVNPSEEIELLLADETSDHDHDHHEEEHGDEDHGHEEEHHHEEEHDHDHGRYDPHYWLSPQNAMTISQEISEALQQEDPENSDYYETQYSNYVSELETLDTEYEENLDQCEKETILITHPAFAYLGQDYGFEQIAIEGIGHMTEPTAQELQRLADEAEEHNLGYIFYDPVSEAEAAETIANELDHETETLPLHSVEAVENPDQETYLSLMEQNLENLEMALEC